MSEKILRTLSILLTLLFINVSPISDLVVCFEADGNIKIEKAYNGECYPSSGETSNIPSPSSLMLTVSYHERYCKSCVDLSFSCSDEMIPSTKNKLPKAKPPLLTTITFTLPSFAEAKTKRFSNPLQPTNPFTLSNVVLLI